MFLRLCCHLRHCCFLKEAQRIPFLFSRLAWPFQEVIHKHAVRVISVTHRLLTQMKEAISKWTSSRTPTERGSTLSEMFVAGPFSHLVQTHLPFLEFCQKQQKVSLLTYNHSRSVNKMIEVVFLFFVLSCYLHQVIAIFVYCGSCHRCRQEVGTQAV